ncbi:MAG TPA: MerR family transcriptional regulator [Candidatus Binatia bacterium]|nr:MerR family transcriptional regulator [Candidatus Binatia bacterium]
MRTTRGAVLRIGAVAARAGVGVQTLRFYERRGLVQPAGRSASGYRAYRGDAVARVRAIKRAQGLGFTLAEIAALGRLGRDGRAGDVRALAEGKLRALDDRLRALRRARTALRTLLTTCGCAGELARCRVVEGMA